MKRKLIWLLSGMMLGGCTDSIKISESEDKGIKEVIGLYGG
jgi:hypothetical protein